MKKIIGVVLLIISIYMIIRGSILLVDTKTYIVKFKNVEGLSQYEIVKGGYIQVPDEPIKSGYEFIGWYYNGELFNFNQPITENIEIEARWELIS